MEKKESSLKLKLKNKKDNTPPSFEFTVENERGSRNSSSHAAAASSSPRRSFVVVDDTVDLGCVLYLVGDYDEFGRDEFSFGNRPVPNGVEHEGPVLSKLGPSSTAELHPKSAAHDDAKPTAMPPANVMTRLILIIVWQKLIRNPNTYSSLIGLIWSLVSFRWHVEMPAIVAGSIAILSKAGPGMAMFSLGLFMAL
ncbi:hypothetical protein LWI28_026812 [Acer negundo]|uniref:PIN-like protein n=1 Tax=Acer negundo TaxID=4023 RepID=A0AAD5IBW0_ACENE|nr:hypothetical protein LWI28_026812 [Acer negundo]